MDQCRRATHTPTNHTFRNGSRRPGVPRARDGGWAPGAAEGLLPVIGRAVQKAFASFFDGNGSKLASGGEETKMKTNLIWEAAGLLLMVGCGDGSPEGDLSSSAGSMGGGGGSNKTGGGTGGGISALGPPCGSPSPMPVAVGWNEQTALGVSPAEAFMALVGTCSSPLKWDASRDGDYLAVSPASGTSQLTVTVTADESSVRFTPEAAGGVLALCKAKLSVDASVHLETDDGTFVADGTANVAYDGTNYTPLNFTVPLEQLGGTLSIQPKTKGTGVALSFDVGPIGKGCAGEVRMETAAALPGGHGAVGTSGTFGSWSSTGCAVGETCLAPN
jgi:hypothetical protein